MASNRTPIIIVIVVALLLFCVCLTVAGAAGVYYYRSTGAAVNEAEAVEYVLDVSGRMGLPAEGRTTTRLEVAQGVMAEILRPTRGDVQMALRVFGSGAQPAACQDTTLLLPLAQDNQQRIATELVGLQPGSTEEAPLVEAMIAAIRNLAQGSGFRSLVVVTGGQDDCQVEAARLVADEAARAGIELRTFVIGFQVPASEQAAIKTIAEASGEGIYLDAPDETALREALRLVQAYIQAPSAETLLAVEMLATALEQGPPVADLPTPPAAEPLETPAEAPTSALAATTTPEPAVTPTATAAAASSSGLGQTACDHPYFPLRPGASWTYEGVSEGESFRMTWTVTGVTGDRLSATATMQAEFDGLFTASYTWECDEEGITSYDYNNFSFTGMDFEVEGMSFTTTVVDQNGVMLPPPDQLTPGATWEHAFVSRIAISMTGMSYTMDFANAESYTAIGVESVTVTAGSFEALRVDSTGGSTTSNSLSPGFDIATSSTGSVWYGRGVGWLRIINVVDGERSSWELVNYTLP